MDMVEVRLNITCNGDAHAASALSYVPGDVTMASIEHKRAARRIQEVSCRRTKMMVHVNDDGTTSARRV